MGCAQSKPSYNSSGNRKSKRTGMKKSSTAEQAQKEISSTTYKADEQTFEQEDFGYRSMPEEDTLIKEQKTMSKRSSIRSILQLQPNAENMDMENKEGKLVKQNEVILQTAQSKPEDNHYSGTNLTKIRTNPDSVVSTLEMSGKNNGHSILSVQEDTNSEKYLVTAAQFRGTIKERKVSPAKSFSPDEEDFAASVEGEVLVDKPDYMGEPLSHVAPLQEFYAQPERSLGNISSGVGIQQTENLRNAASTQWTLHPNSSSDQDKVVSFATEASLKPYNSLYLNESQSRNESHVMGNMSDVIVSRPMDSTEVSIEDIGSICIDASTGEYIFYERGVAMGRVDKEEAERLAKDWRICTGTAENEGIFHRLASSRCVDKTDGMINTFQSRPQIRKDHFVNQLNCGHPISYQQIVGDRINGQHFSEERQREQVVATLAPEHRGYYM